MSAAHQTQQSPGGAGLVANNQYTHRTPIIGNELSSDKSFRSLQASFALAGHVLARTDPRDGPVSLYVTRWGFVRPLRDLDEARAFLMQIGGAE